MKLPDNPRMETTQHGSSRQGGYFYRYEDRAAGVVAEVRRETRRAPEVIAYSYVWLPDKTFASYDELRAAAEAIAEEQVAAERASFPKIRSVGPATANGECRLCPSVPSRDPREQGRRPPAVVDVSIAVNPDPHADRFCRLCGAHRPLADDARALIAALDAQLAGRRAVHAARLDNRGAI